MKNHIVRAMWAVALLVPALFYATPDAAAQPSKPDGYMDDHHGDFSLKPVSLCILRNDDGTRVARFGYINKTNSPLTIPIGREFTDNWFEGLSGTPYDRGQPTVFQPGIHYLEFNVQFLPGEEELEWHLGDRKVEAHLWDEECGFIKPFLNCTVHATVKEIENGGPGPRKGGHGDETRQLRAYFGYVHTGLIPVTIPIGDYVDDLHNDINCVQLSTDGAEVCDHGQPTVFEPGQHDAVFNILIEDDWPMMLWKLSDAAEGDNDHHHKKNVWADWKSHQCNVKPISNCIAEGCSIPGETGQYSAYFGYVNYEPFTVEIPTGFSNVLFPRMGCEELPELDQEDNDCSQPQVTKFEPGEHNKVWGACFDHGNAGVLGWDVTDESSLLNRLKSLIYGDNYLQYFPGVLLWRLGDIETCNHYRQDRTLSNDGGPGGEGDYVECMIEEVMKYLEQVAVHYNMSVLAQDLSSRICNRAPICNAGGDYVLDCTGELTHIFMNAFASYDPDGDALAYSWTQTCPSGVLTGADRANPILGVTNPGDGVAESCTTTLTVTEQGTEDKFSTSCTTGVSVAACPVDCFKDAYGRATIDLCGKCGGNNACVDCAGVINGTATVDRFGVCNGDGTEGLGCQDRSIVPDLYNLNYSAYEMYKKLYAGVQTVRKLRKNVRYGKKEATLAQQLTQANVNALKSAPTSVTNCTNTKFCVKVAATSAWQTLKDNTDKLQVIANKIVTDMKNSKGGRNLAKRYKASYDERFQIQYSTIGSLPTTTAKCS